MENKFILTSMEKLTQEQNSEINFYSHLSTDNPFSRASSYAENQSCDSDIILCHVQNQSLYRFESESDSQIGISDASQNLPNQPESFVTSFSMDGEIGEEARIGNC